MDQNRIGNFGSAHLSLRFSIGPTPWFPCSVGITTATPSRFLPMIGSCHPNCGPMHAMRMKRGQRDGPSLSSDRLDDQGQASWFCVFVDLVIGDVDFIHERSHDILLDKTGEDSKTACSSWRVYAIAALESSSHVRAGLLGVSSWPHGH